MSARVAIEFLRQNPLFAALPSKELHDLAAVAQAEHYRARDFIFREGDAATGFYLVQRGRVKIVRAARNGREVVLDILGPGEPFGGVAAIEGKPYPASAQTTEPCVVLRVPRGPVVAIAHRHPSIIREMALMMGRRLRGAHDSVKSLATDPVEARLAAAFLRLAEREGARSEAGLSLPFHLTRQSLADLTGTTVETAIRIVRRWLRDGLILEEDGRFVLRDVAALQGLAGGEEG